MCKELLVNNILRIQRYISIQDYASASFGLGRLLEMLTTEEIVNAIKKQKNKK